MNFADYKNLVFLILVFLTPSFNAIGQGLPAELAQKIEQPRQCRIMFYNCENLFDYIDDSLTMDEEFTPEGARYWTKSRYYNKLSQISKVITAVGGWTPPELVGLCEIENKKTLYDLTRNSPLYSAEYQFIHNESPDIRGIDVALLYQPKKFKPLQTQFITINFPNEPNKHTRQILYTCGVILPNDTLHVYVNHWPSKYGGVMETVEYRGFVASVLKTHTDSILSHNPGAEIVVMGDFNDAPSEPSISEVLQAKTNITDTVGTQLYNVTQIAYKKSPYASHKYQGTWSLLDQFIVSGNLLYPNASLHTDTGWVTIFNAPFLLEIDDAYLGQKPFRSFSGFSYQGGFSDHLPVFIDLNSN